MVPQTGSRGLSRLQTMQTRHLIVAMDAGKMAKPFSRKPDHILEHPCTAAPTAAEKRATAGRFTRIARGCMPGD